MEDDFLNGPLGETHHQRVLRVLLHIQTHLDEALSLTDLAQMAHYSPYHFHRVFRGMVGESLMAHVRRLRLERAAYQLKHGGQAVTQIAFAAGYEAHEAFTRAFRGMFGESPSAFREMHRQIPYPASPSGVHFSPDGRVETFAPLTAGDSDMEVVIEKLEPIQVAFLRHVGPYHEVGETWNKLCSWAGPRGLFGPDTKFLGVCHDDPEVTPADKIRYDACITVNDGFQPEGEVGVQQIEGGDYARVTHHGPYERLNESWGFLCGQWLPNSGREMRMGPGFEIYLNSPEETAPEELLTDIHLPLQPK